MNNWTTIRTFEFPYEAIVIRSLLESEGIECSLKDELTAQVNPFYSNAIGGVKLQVKESDLTDALIVLKLAGYWQEPTKTVSETAVKIDRFTSKIPLFGKLEFIPRLMLLVSIIIGVPMFILFYPSPINVYEKLSSQYWCIDYVEYHNKVYLPETVEEYISFNLVGVCEEYIEFGEDYSISAPGFRSPSVRARWKVAKPDSVTIFNANNLDYLYDGTYKIDYRDNKLILKSKTTTVHCHQNIPILDFRQLIE